MPLERHFLIRGQSEFLELLILMSDFCENVVQTADSPTAHFIGETMARIQ